jgi:hypothetical protein
MHQEIDGLHFQPGFFLTLAAGAQAGGLTWPAFSAREFGTPSQGTTFGTDPDQISSTVFDYGDADLGGAFGDHLGLTDKAMQIE